MLPLSDVYNNPSNSLSNFRKNELYQYMDKSNCVETTYPRSIYDLEESISPPRGRSSTINNTIAEIFNSSISSTTDSPIINENINYYNNCQSRHEKIDPSGSICYDDRLSAQSLQEELDNLTYSQPHTPSEPLLSPNDYTNSLSTIENISITSGGLDEEISIKTNRTNEQTRLKSRNYDTSFIMYENDDMTAFTSLVNCNDVLQRNKDKRESQDNTIVCCYKSQSPSYDEIVSTSQIDRAAQKNTMASSNLSSNICIEDNKKGKISVLQRHALDMIFEVTDRPSRGLVLHIAGELCLHHITVKNFFSNGRRRLRRAAARLNDPERTRRENQRRKEKRRLAALAAAAASGEKGNGLFRHCTDENSEATASREPAVLSPERKALMEKLAVKVQRSVAQKGLVACFPKSQQNTSSPHFISASTTITSPQPFQIHSSIPVEKDNIRNIKVPYLTSDEDDLVNMLSYSESDAVSSSYNSSPEQNYFNAYTSNEMHSPLW